MVWEAYELWKERTKEKNGDLYAELCAIEGNPKEIEDRFYRELAFGTGGLRGTLGAGTNRMNIYTVARATLGLASYLLKTAARPSVAIAYDSRILSREFARLAAEALSSQGIRAYLFTELMPTPVLSYTVRKLGASAGIVITASHNPHEYNGYKVYNGRGCQITDEAAAAITREIGEVEWFREFAPDPALITMIGEEILSSFLREIGGYSLFGECEKYAPEIVYTPLNGTGNKPVRRILSEIGAKVAVVPEQELPDGNFPTCPYPNPEVREALSLALRLAEERKAGLVLATDPDADRVGIAVRCGEGYRLLNGNETGVLLEDFILAMRGRKGTLPERPVVVKTIVTSDMATAVAAHYGAEVREVLTGFKYIGETIDRLDDSSRFVMGLEESYGYLVGTHARDKDAVSAAMLIAEMAAYWRSRGKSLAEALEELYRTYGYYGTKLLSRTYGGKAGSEQMKQMLLNLRAEPWKNVCGMPVVCRDYLGGLDGLPASDVLSFTGEKIKIVVRPSGTEPKIKVYLQAKGDTRQESDELLAEAETFVGASL